MKLPNGFGSVYKLSGNRRKPYRAIVTERWQIDTETGKWKQKRKTIGYYESKKEALQALADYNNTYIYSRLQLQSGSGSPHVHQ